MSITTENVDPFAETNMISIPSSYICNLCSTIYLCIKNKHVECLKSYVNTHDLDTNPINIRSEYDLLVFRNKSAGQHTYCVSSMPNYVLTIGSRRNLISYPALKQERERKKLIKSLYLNGTVLHWAVYKNCEECVDLIAQNTNYINTSISHIGTPLQLAILTHRHNIITLLIQKGADLDVRNEFNQTPIHNLLTNSFQIGKLIINYIIDSKVQVLRDLYNNHHCILHQMHMDVFCSFIEMYKIIEMHELLKRHDVSMGLDIIINR